MEKKIITCVVCPNGCQIEVSLEGNKITDIKGNSCKRGEVYAREECTHPSRMITSTVLVKGGRLPVAAVRTDRPVPKEKIMDCMQEIYKVRAQAPLSIGQIVLENVAGTGANVIITRRDEGV